MSASTPTPLPARRDRRRASPRAPVPATPLFAQVRDTLRGEILCGGLAPGDRLPSESDLIARFGVSRVTVRQALAELQSSGLIATLNGKGSYVTRPDHASAHGPLVGVLETMRKRGHHARGHLLGHAVKPATVEVATALGVPPGALVGAVTVLRYRDEVPFVVGTSYCTPALAQRLAAQDLSDMDVMVALEDRLGMRIARTGVAVEARLADTRLARRLHCKHGAALLRIRTISHDHDGTPCIYSVTDCRGDMMDYRVTLRR